VERFNGPDFDADANVDPARTWLHSSAIRRAAMKILKNLLLMLLALIAVVLLIALFLPSRYQVERRIVIQAKPQAIFPWINDPKKWPEWTAWNKEKDPTLAF